MKDSDSAVWEYKVIKDKTYQLVEDFGEFGHALIEEFDTLQELEKYLVDDFFAKIKAIRNYDES